MDRAGEDDLVIDSSPPLIAVLLAAERAKGSPLTEEEVLDIRDGATCIRLPRSVAEATAEQRGYPDLDPERCWEQRRAVRTELANWRSQLRRPRGCPRHRRLDDVLHRIAHSGTAVAPDVIATLLPAATHERPLMPLTGSYPAFPQVRGGGGRPGAPSAVISRDRSGHHG